MIAITLSYLLEESTPSGHYEKYGPSAQLQYYDAIRLEAGFTLPGERAMPQDFRAQHTGNQKELSGILETCLYCRDLQAGTAFYQDLLLLELRFHEKHRHSFFRCGAGMLLLFNPDRTSDPSATTPPHGTKGPGHVAFAIPQKDLAWWSARLADFNVPIETTTTWPSGAMSLYFRDPAGNSVEITSPSIWGIQETDRGCLRN